MSSSPDEPDHIVKAEATVHGELTGGSPSKYPGKTYVEVPADVSVPGGDISCFAFHANVSAACVPAQHVSSSRALVPKLTGVGAYNPLYYAIVGVPSLFLAGNKAWFAMRLVSALLNSFFIGILFFAAVQLRRAPAFLAWTAIALTPEAMYLSGMVNPNSTEIVGCAALAALAWLVVSDPTRHRLAERMTLIAIAGVLVGNTRALSPLYVFLILLAVVISFPFRGSADLLRRRSVLVGLAVGVAGMIVAALWTLFISAPAGFIPTSTPHDGFGKAFITTLTNTTDFGRMMVGRTGWLDTSLPGAVYIGWAAITGFVVMAVVIAGFKRRSFGAFLLMVAVVLVPPIVQAPSVKTFGYIWQGRYTLPVYVAMILIAGIAAERYVLRRLDAPRIVAIVTAATGVGQLTAWVVTYRRYATGITAPWRDLLHATPWAPPGGPIPVTVIFLLGTVGTCVLSFFVSRSVVAAGGTGFELSEAAIDEETGEGTDGAAGAVPDDASRDLAREPAGPAWAPEPGR